MAKDTSSKPRCVCEDQAFRRCNHISSRSPGTRLAANQTVTLEGEQARDHGARTNRRLEVLEVPNVGNGPTTTLECAARRAAAIATTGWSLRSLPADARRLGRLVWRTICRLTRLESIKACETTAEALQNAFLEASQGFDASEPNPPKHETNRISSSSKSPKHQSATLIFESFAVAFRAWGCRQINRSAGAEEKVDGQIRWK
ncbi:uncharacterized protein IWZ02DRAFT_114061 [Phyllosticta citriasiana]|uniref:uncharacterized protein n=1 Tax=Phyllosticta citriasiana TaxID=595635 RepID=UPI0030FDA311